MSYVSQKDPHNIYFLEIGDIHHMKFTQKTLVPVTCLETT